MFEDFASLVTVKEQTNGSIKDMSSASAEARNGSTVEASELLRKITADLSPTVNKFTLQMISTEEDFVSDFLNREEIITINSPFMRLSENDFFIQIAFVVDEICRMVEEGRTSVLILSYIDWDELEDRETFFKKAWVVDGSYRLMGIPSHKLIETFDKAFKAINHEFDTHFRYNSSEHMDLLG